MRIRVTPRGVLATIFWGAAGLGVLMVLAGIFSGLADQGSASGMNGLAGVSLLAIGAALALFGGMLGFLTLVLG